jgi:hypothetical protein
LKYVEPSINFEIINSTKFVYVLLGPKKEDVIDTYRKVRNFVIILSTWYLQNKVSLLLYIFRRIFGRNHGWDNYTVKTKDAHILVRNPQRKEPLGIKRGRG